MTEAPIIVVLGVGPGIGGSVAKRFSSEGYTTVLISRQEENTIPVRSHIESQGGIVYAYHTDISVPENITSLFETIRSDVGNPDVLVYNVARFVRGGILELSAEDFVQSWQAGCLGGFLAAKEVLPAMQEKAKGTILFTGATASLRGGAKFAGFSVSKFGLRSLAQSMAREFGPLGVHVAHVIIDGIVDFPRTRAYKPGASDEEFLNPDAIANEYWNLHTQHPSTWTFELDLRPNVENW
eukprot:TRINITY_DN12962_c0_g1_i1.p1 TRINITY_DN12962_c0_g1~~TRINITY_DN12962_c0_g1_i1.p1  ORF type:complete len:249 (+),score=44.83 TRINITY_DN12962_c0_g1_i1:31-747(+)